MLLRADDCCGGVIIGINSDDDFASELAGGMQITDVPNVKQVETSVGQRNARAGAAPLGHASLQFAARKDLGLD